MNHHLAQLNVARLAEPPGSESNTEFFAVLDAVNAIAEVSPGFVWRLKDESGLSSAYISGGDDPQLIINMTVWESVEALTHYAYRSGHGSYFRRRKEWFEPANGIPSTVCWWIEQGTVPTADDGLARLESLRADGPSVDGFFINDPKPAPAAG
ncbi:MAG: DUF3291 domain-containing protein [Acidimicrobiia bacterium]